MKENSFRNIIQNFIINMEETPNTLDPQCQSALSEPCEFLRIGRITADFFESPRERRMNVSEKYLLYTVDSYNLNAAHTVIKTTPVGSTVVYNIYPLSSVDKWDEEELERLDVLLKMLFVFNGRSKLMHANYKLTFFDQDLEIYNLKYFFRILGELLAKGEIYHYAALYMNLKHFSAVNLQLGREIGTLVMKRFIGHISAMFGKNELIARIGGDRFAILVRQKKLGAVIDALNGTAITFDDRTNDRILISACAGVYVIDGEIPVKAPSDIMDRISVGIAVAKMDSQSDIAFFDKEMLAQNQKSLLISSTFPIALENEEFLIYYQPKVSLENYQLVGAEALCRWKRNGKLIPPAEFIPVLERGIDICKLDFYMLDHVCRDIRRWLDEGKKVVKISVNLSRRHLSDMDLLQHIMEIIDRNDVPHQYIEVELTETTTDVEFNDLKRVISGLQETGISTSVDDFGVGYSSLTLIKDIPWDVLKIDKSFLPEEGEVYDRKKEIMLKYVIAMAQEMGLVTVAEGIETMEQLEVLKNNSCNIIQGYYFDKPLPVHEFEDRLDNFQYMK